MTARITLDAGGGPQLDFIVLPGAQVNTPVTLANLDNTGVLGWKWEVVDAPAPSLGLNPLPPPVFTSTTIVTPDVKGHTVLVRLTTYQDVARTILDDVDTATIGVQFDPPFDWVIPAAGQTIEANVLRGWAEDVNRILRELHDNISAATKLKTVLTPPVIGADQNDYNPANLATAEILRLEPSGGTRALTGLDSEGGTPSNRNVIRIINVSTTEQLNLNHQDVGSLAVNRFLIPGAPMALILGPGDAQPFYYDEVVSFWRPI